MGILKRVKTLEERYGTSKKRDELIIRLRRFSAGWSDPPPVEEQMRGSAKRARR